MGEGGAACTSGVEGKERRKKEKWGRERRALYEREKKRDEGGTCKNLIGFRDLWREKEDNRIRKTN